MTEMLLFINDLLWGAFLTWLLAGVGIWLSWRFRAFLLRPFAALRYVLRYSQQTSDRGLSPWQGLLLSLVARSGTGNMTGVAIALTAGGPGAVFWMWVMALFSMALSMLESILAQSFKVRDRHGRYCGGPAWYMAIGLDMRWMGALFAAFLVLAFGLLFNAVHARSIALSLQQSFHLAPLTCGLLLLLPLAAALNLRRRWIVRLAASLIPLLIGLYWLIALWVIGQHLADLPGVFSAIFRHAFGLPEAAGGLAGYTVTQAISYGFRQGIVANEAGIGSTPNATALVDACPPHPVSQGYLQLFGVFIDTFLTSTITALLILCTGALQHAPAGVHNILLTQQAFASNHLGWEAGVLSVIILGCAFTTIIVNYWYARNQLDFLWGEKKSARFSLQLGVLGMVALGSVTHLSVLWYLANIATGLMTLTNLAAILLLSPIGFKLLRDYHLQLNNKKWPTFHRNHYPDLFPPDMLQRWRQLEQPPER